jgi:hypothetical protein
MKRGQPIEFYLFGVKEKGTIIKINEDSTIHIEFDGYTYPNTQILKVLPKKSKDVPPWYILK